MKRPQAMSHGQPQQYQQLKNPNSVSTDSLSEWFGQSVQGGDK
jgi:hypothetical protein